MGGVYTAPALLILLYITGIERALLLLFLNNAPYSSMLRALAAKHLSLTNRAVFSILLYVYTHNGNAHTMVALYRLSGLSIRSSDMSPIIRLILVTFLNRAYNLRF